MSSRTRRCAVALLAVLSLGVAAPSATYAQGAGDEQYADPFSEDQGGQGKDQGSGGDAGSNDRADAGSQATPSSTPSPTPSTGSDTASSNQASESAAPAGEELPRTGYPAWLAALAGGVMVASGGVLLAAPRRA